MGKYIGVVQESNGFYNYKPLAEIQDDGGLDLLDSSRRQQLLPESQKESICLYYYPKSTELMRSNFPHDNRLMILELNPETDLEDNLNYKKDNARNAVGYKVTAQDYFDSRRLRPIFTEGFYYMQDKSAFASDLPFGSQRTAIGEGDYVEEDRVLFTGQVRNAVIGPFKIMRERGGTDKYYFNNRIREQKYTVSGYDRQDCKFYTLKDSDDYWGEGQEWKIASINDGSKPRYYDVISDEQLLEAFSDLISKRRTEGGKLDASDIIDSYKGSILEGAEISKKVREERESRLREIIEGRINSEDVEQRIIDLVANLLLEDKNGERFESIVGSILEQRQDFINRIQNVRIVQESIQELTERRDELRNELNSALEEDAARKTLKADNLTAADEERLRGITERLGVAEDLEALTKQRDELTSKNTYLEQHNAELSNNSKKLEVAFGEIIARHQEQMVDIAFDGFMANKLLGAASEWEADQTNKEYETIVDKVQSVDVESDDPTVIIESLIKTIQGVRPQYDRNTIINIMTCVTQGFLTVFSGKPGCGKTSICNIVGRALGLDSLSELCGDVRAKRYVPVSVERGWTSKRDFIGYYNPLSKTFDKNNKQLYDAFMIMDMEEKKGLSKIPFLILLDEANLSPMEYYWADFMNLCDDRGINNQINLGENYVFTIPQGLHFLATINNDHTTEVLSPRLIDRAWIITLPSVDISDHHEVQEIETDRVFSCESLKSAFSSQEDLSRSYTTEVRRIMDIIERHLAKMNMTISARSREAMRRYWGSAAHWMVKDELDTDATIVAIDYAIAQKVLPSLAGNGDEYEEWIKEFSNICKINNLSISESMINNIIDRGNRQMKYYQFFE